jgi:hypothetical protein
MERRHVGGAFRTIWSGSVLVRRFGGKRPSYGSRKEEGSWDGLEGWMKGNMMVDREYNRWVGLDLGARLESMSFNDEDIAHIGDLVKEPSLALHARLARIHPIVVRREHLEHLEHVGRVEVGEHLADLRLMADVRYV